MSTYYCHPCAAKLGHLQNVYTSGLLQSPYQLDKFIKHTLPGEDASVFASTSTGPYGQYVVGATASGLVEIDDKGRRNFIYVAGQTIGFDYRDGQLIGPVEGVKVALSSDGAKIHAFPVSVTGLTTEQCASCGSSIAR